MPRTRLAVGVAVGLVALTLTLAGNAQDKPPLKKSAAPPARAEKDGPASTTMYLFLRTGPDENDADIRNDLVNALKAAEAKYTGEVKLKAVSPTFYDELLSLVDQAAPAAAAAGDVAVRRLPAQGVVYELTIGDAQVLKKLTVKYKSGLSKEYVAEARKDGDDKKSPLVFIVPGRYAFTPEVNETPVEYAAEVAEIEKPDATLKSPWPVSDKHFVVTLQGFEGNREVLFSKLRDGNVVPALYEVKRSDDLLFAFASLKSIAGEVKEEDVGPNYVGLNAESLKTGKAKRAWVYYPLNGTELAAAVEKFRDPKYNRESLCEEIRKAAVPLGNAPPLKTDEPAKWYELGPDAEFGGFYRKVEVENLFDLAAKYPTIGKLIVWEFDNGMTKPQAIPVLTPKAELGKVNVLERLNTSWQAKVKAALERQKKDKEK